MSGQAAAFREGLEDLCSSPAILLTPFALPELQTILCGTSTIAPWSEAELRSALQPAAPYTREAAPYALLVEELMRFGEGERAKFLAFVTACPHLPPSGLKALAISVHRKEPLGLRWVRCSHGRPASGRELRSPALSDALRLKMSFSRDELSAFGLRDLHADDWVKVKDAAGGASAYYTPADTPVPTSHTCTATLSLPAYTTADELRAGLDEAFANMEKGGLHEQH